MKKLYTLFNLFIICFLTGNVLTAYSQQTISATNNSPVSKYLVGAERDLTVSDGAFYYEGGKTGETNAHHAITTFHAKENLIELYFTKYTIPYGAELKIYEGNSPKDKLLGTIHQGDKIKNYRGENITLEYIPSVFATSGTFGWTGGIRTVNPNDHVQSMPESDCPYAIPLCSNTTVVALGGLYTDLGLINDDDGTCYAGTGSGGSVWYSFTPQQNGPIDFSIAPTGTTDYDFVVWDITAGCATGQRNELACNYSLYTGTTGMSSVNCSEAVGGGGNCSGNDCVNESKESDCNRFNQRVNVVTTGKYAICINFYSGSNDGFTLQFKNEASSVPINDTIPPTILNAYTNNCTSASQFHLFFSEYVDCTTIQDIDFSLAGYTFTVTNTNCIGGMTNQVDISVVPALTSGTYSLHVQDIYDFCGNNMNSNFDIVLGTPPVITASPDVTTCRTPGFLGFGWVYSPTSQTLNASGGSFYMWSDGQLGSTISVSPTATTTYVVTATSGACAATDTVTVFMEDAPEPDLGPNVNLCSGSSVTIGSTTGATYQWYRNPNIFGNGTLINGATADSMTVNPTTTTTYRIFVTSASGCEGYDDIRVTVVPAPTATTTSVDATCGGTDGTAMVVASGGTAPYTYLWNDALAQTTDTATNLNAGTYTCTVTDASGCTVTVTAIVGSGTGSIVATISPDTTICPGNPVTLTAAGGTNYLWSTSDTTGSILVAPDFTSTYTAIVSSGSASCSDTVAVTITVYSAPTAPVITQNGDTLFATQGYAGYQWYYGSVVITGATNYFYVGSVSGNYNLVVTDSNGCQVGAGVINVPLGIDQASNTQNQISIYPNPTSGQFTIRSLELAISSIKIYNTIGEKVFCEQLNTKSQTLNTTLAAGFYFVKIIAREKIFNQKLIVE